MGRDFFTITAGLMGGADATLHETDVVRIDRVNERDFHGSGTSPAGCSSNGRGRRGPGSSGPGELRSWQDRWALWRLHQKGPGALSPRKGRRTFRRVSAT